ncbi:MAG: YggS family pyridoxal phosphate-dependent enzyme [Actinobacteria bacterium]|nr:YggS family pyridoxal phosphate-dependent enzyme [Actinomycetota bacterium]
MKRSLKTAADLDVDRIRANLEKVRKETDAACRRAGRGPGEVEILAAAKYVAPDGLTALAEAGINLIGENRAQDLVVKHSLHGDRFTWDFIGHLQSNKVRQILPLVRLIHSVDSLSAVAEIDLRTNGPTPTNVLLEVNIGQEEGKYGIIPSEVDRFLEEAKKYLKVNFTGLMTMPPLAADPEVVRPAFAALRRMASRLSREWRGRYQFHHLSMGTSHDFAVAVEEGATIIRVGGALFE